MVAHDLLELSPLVLASLVPTTLILAAPGAGRSPFGAASFVTALSVGLSALAVSLHAVLVVVGLPPSTSKFVLAFHGLAQLDLTSSAMLVLVTVLGVVVVRYSRTYLAGEHGLDRYARSLLMTLASVTLLIITNNLALLIAGWIAADLFLHQLLMFYRTRRLAVIVAHKKFLLSRVADMCFFGALAFVSAEIGSFRIDAMNAFVRTHGELSTPLQIAALLLVLGVLLKTAQVPFHGWMTQVMEAPTPVSALLHAGVVNVGGFVMIRLSPVMAHAKIAQGVLVGVGLITAIIGSLVMTTRMSIKVVLAWSTIAQMGFMLMQCGLGVWHLALLHLLAHSFYKAHAFLSAGSVVETWRGTTLIQPSRLKLRYMAVAAVVACIAAAPFYAALTVYANHASVPLASLSVVLVLSFLPMLARALDAGWRAFALTTLFTVGAAASYFIGHALFEAVFPSIDAGPPSSLAWEIVGGALVMLFIVQTALQRSPNGRLARWVQPHILSGFYIDDWFTRMTFRLWPPRLERATGVSPASTRPRPPLESRQ